MPALKRVKRKGNPFGETVIGDVSFVVGVDVGNVVNVALQLKDHQGKDLAIRGSVEAYLSDDANGDSIIATAHSGTVVIGTDGVALVREAKKQFRLISEADGDIDLNITEAGAKVAYLVVVLPDGTLKVSGAITHGA
jgi:sporulation protein YlmC with PRC-barrel domain